MADAPVTESAPKAPWTKKQKMWVGIGSVVGVLVVGGIAYGAYSVGRNAAPEPTPVVSATATAMATATPTPKATSTAAVTDEGVTWLAEPQALSDQGLITIDNGSGKQVAPNDVYYYKVGTDGTKDIIFVRSSNNSIGYVLFHFLKTDATHYELLSSISDKKTDDGTYSDLVLTSKVTGTNAKIYKSLIYQTKLTLKGVEVPSTGTTLGWFLDEKARYGTSIKNGSLVEFATTPYGTVYQSDYSTDEGSSAQAFILRRPNGTTVRYQLRPPFFKDDNIPAVTWTDGTANTAEYRYDGYDGCGSSSSIFVLAANQVSALKAAGKTSGNETIYTFTDVNNVVVQSLVKAYNTYGALLQPAQSVTAADYLAKHGVFAYKDKLDRYVLLNGGPYNIVAECGKPVVYLYPTKMQAVSVKVDADITVSDPAYGNGWNVIAQPDGTLTNVDGQKYESLFWEGTGAEYPDITEGFVVPRQVLEPTLWAHLAKLGMNDNESADFMEFWMPHMPKTPYVRLTWFGTRQMDKLAPLTVTPTPDSVIRIFLDFAGLQEPISLPEQKLSSIARKGFTVTEWGGLLRK